MGRLCVDIILQSGHKSPYHRYTYGTIEVLLSPAVRSLPVTPLLLFCLPNPFGSDSKKESLYTKEAAEVVLL